LGTKKEHLPSLATYEMLKLFEKWLVVDVVGLIPILNRCIPSPYPVTVVVAKLLLDPAEAQESETKSIPKHCIRIC
jgi:hypothetical protein